MVSVYAAAQRSPSHPGRMYAMKVAAVAPVTDMAVHTAQGGRKQLDG